MAKIISSRTPEGSPNHCPVCDSVDVIEPSQPPGDAPCPKCGALLWFFNTSTGMRLHESRIVTPLWDRIIEFISESFGVDKQQITPDTTIDDLGGDSLDLVEHVMELEEEWEISIPDKGREDIGTLGDLLDFLLKQDRDYS